MSRKIIHIDMDAFFASVEQRDYPELRGKPVIVGGEADKRGVVSTCSYEARKYGIHSAMPTATAKRLCPHGIFVPPRFDTYREISQQIRELMYHYTPLVEPLSLDEAYLDVSDSPHEHGSATRIAERLRQEIHATTQLTASAGVSYCKMLAKIASDLNKPNGIAIILPEQAADFIAQLPIEKFHGIGKATAEKMHALNIKTGADLRQTSPHTLIQHFGKIGAFYYEISNGRDNREVKPSRERKSIGSETTFAHDLENDQDILTALYTRHQEAYAELRKRQLHARTLTIKLKYHDFTQITRSHSVHPYLPDARSALPWIHKLYQQTPRNKPVRLAGISYSHFTHQSHVNLRQQELFSLKYNIERGNDEEVILDK